MLRYLMMQDPGSGPLDVPRSFRPDAPDIQIPSASLPKQTADPDAMDTKKPDVPVELPVAGGDGADEEVGTKKAELPASMAS